MILLDTQVVLWVMGDKRRLSLRAAKAIREARVLGEGLSIASSSLWEVAMSSHSGKVRLQGSLSEYLSALERVFDVLPITSAVAAKAVSFSTAYPRDPTDRIIGATALVHNAKLVTADWAIRKSGEVECVW